MTNVNDLIAKFASDEPSKFLQWENGWRTYYPGFDLTGFAEALLAEAALAAQQDAWQPIETAPKNEVVLCFAPHWECPCGLIFTEVYQGGAIRTWQWRDDSGDSFQDYQPTHWMRWPKLNGTVEQ